MGEPSLRPAPEVSLVAPILLLRGVPAYMPDVTIKVECNGGHGILDIVRPDVGLPGQVFVIFEELKCAPFFLQVFLFTHVRLAIR